MVWVKSELSRKRQKGVAAAVAYIMKDVGYLKTSYLSET